MNWTTERPTREGVYWVRDRFDKNVSIAELTHDFDGEPRMWTGHFSYPLDDFTHFCGPLEPPPLPEEKP